MIVHSDGVEHMKSTIHGRMVWKMGEDRAMSQTIEARQKTNDNGGRIKDEDVQH
jgi:hypothetical protein